MIGKKYGNLTVIEMLPNYNNTSKTYCRCLCVCGKETIKNSFTLRKSKTASCGCLTGYYRSIGKQKDIVGKTFHYLTVIEIDSHSRPPIAICKCKCGNIVKINKNDIMSGHTKSCGCYQKQRAKEYNTKDFSGMVSDCGVIICERSKQNKKGVWLWKCKCPLCGKYFEALPIKVLSNHTTSCGCKIRSSKERIIEKILKELNVKYETQKRFLDCKYKHTLPFDFVVYNNDMTIKCLIEYDGKQHFVPIHLYGGEKQLKKMQIRDSIKNTYCKDNDYNLLRLNYLDSDNDIKNKIINTIYP